MDWLSILGNLASVAGLAVSCYTLYKVASLSAALKRRSLLDQVAEVLGKVDGIPKERQNVVMTLAREIEHLVKIIRLSEVSLWPFRHRTLKSSLAALETELQGRRQRGIIRIHLQQVRNEIEIG